MDNDKHSPFERHQPRAPFCDCRACEADRMRFRRERAANLDKAAVAFDLEPGLVDNLNAIATRYWKGELQ